MSIKNYFLMTKGYMNKNWLKIKPINIYFLIYFSILFSA